MLKEVLHQIKNDEKSAFFTLYKGLFASILLSGNGIVTFTLYEIIKSELGYKPLDKLTLKKEEFIPFFAGMITKAFTSTLFYPITTIRTRLQARENEIVDHRSVIYNRITDSAKIMYRREGIRSFYKGLSLALVKLIPSQGLFMMVYELCLKYMNAN